MAALSPAEAAAQMSLIGVDERRGFNWAAMAGSSFAPLERQ